MSFRPSQAEIQERREARRAANLQALAQPVRSLHRGVYAANDAAVAPVEKERASQSTSYMRAVKALGYCMHCGARPGKGKLDFCHADQGKGMGLKTDVRLGWPGCRPCHTLIGSTGAMSREEKRELERRLGEKTRAAVRAAGTWPARIGRWEN